MHKRTLYFFLVWVVGLLALLLYPPCTANGTALGIGHHFITDVSNMVTVPSIGYGGQTVATIDWGKLVLEALILSVVIGAIFMADKLKRNAQ